MTDTTTPDAAALLRIGRDKLTVSAHAEEHAACPDCAAAPGEKCVRPGQGKIVHTRRYGIAAMDLRRREQDARRTPEQDAALAALPRIPQAEIEACRTDRGGYRFTPEWLTAHGVPSPPPAGWRRAVERPEELSP